MMASLGCCWSPAADSTVNGRAVHDAKDAGIVTSVYSPRTESNAIDAMFILQLGAALISTLPCPAGGDASGDSATNALDAALVLQFSAGMIGSLPP